jgi:fumarate reductase flavoprotein subunit
MAYRMDERTTTVADQDIQFDADYDLVVIGAGTSGKSAALTAAKAGLSVALLEKREQTGGSGRYAEGLAAFESSEQKARTAPPGQHFPSREEGFRTYMESSRFRANPDLVRTMVDNSAETIDILKSMGVVFTDVLIYAYDQPNELSTFHRPDGLGERMQELYLRDCINAGVDIFTSTPAKKLIVHDGAVVGVQALDSKANTMNIGAKAVVIATGGYGNNREMLRKHWWFGRTADHTFFYVDLENTGDGHNLAVEAGADTEAAALMMALCPRNKSYNSHVSGAGCQPVLWVNKNGARFVNEEVGLHFLYSGYAAALQPDGQVYAIIDSDTVTYLIEHGSDIGLGDFIAYGQKLTRLQTELDEDGAAGIGWNAGTIEGLAGAIGVHPAALAKTVAEYNAACDAGNDSLFYKSDKFLRPIRKPPFYAIDMGPAMEVSCGTIRVNGNLQVLDKDRKPIPGLYATGNDAVGLYGDCYNLDIPGSAQGFAQTSGRVAARHIAKSIKGE